MRCMARDQHGPHAWETAQRRRNATPKPTHNPPHSILAKQANNNYHAAQEPIPP